MKGMTYPKPKGMKYTDLCIYIDEKLKQDTITEEESSVIYKYLYCLIYMLALKHRYFNKQKYYDEFAMWLAADVYNRFFTNPKLKELDENGKPKMAKIKSCLNYLKTILYGRKVSFEQKNYSQKFIDLDRNSSEVLNDNVYYSSIRDSLNFDLDMHMNFYLDSISDTIKHHIYTTSPYKDDKILIKNIYISCMLSILNSLCFTQTETEELENKYTSNTARYNNLCRHYEYNKEHCVILYHLSNKYENYIRILVRQLFTLIGNDIQDLCHSQLSIPEDVLMDIAMLEVTGKDYYDD